MEGIQRSKAWAVFLHVITMLPPTQLKGSESIFHGWCWPQNTEVATKLGTCLDLNSETQFKHRKIFQGNHGNLELYPNTTNQIYNILQHLPESQMVHFTHHNPWLYNPGFFRESFGSSGGLPEKVASWDRPQVWWTAGRRQWPGPADLHGSTNGSKMVCTTKKTWYWLIMELGTTFHGVVQKCSEFSFCFNTLKIPAGHCHTRWFPFTPSGNSTVCYGSHGPWKHMVDSLFP